jgi:WD40 repeat protein
MALKGEGRAITLWAVSHPPARTPIGQPFSDHVYALAFNSVGNVLAAARGVYGGGEVVVELWDTTDASQPIRLSTIDTNASAVAFSPDGQLMATGSTTGTLTVWNVSNPAAPVQIDATQQAHQNAVLSLAFAPGNQVFASAGEDQQLRFWQVIDLKSITPLGTPTTGFSRIPASLTFSPDGVLLAAGDDVSQITLWDVTNLRAPVQLGGPVNVGVSATGIYAGRDARRNREVNKLAFTRDSRTLIATWPVVGHDGRTVDDSPKQFDVDPVSWIVRACQLAGRNLSRAEWAQYLGDLPYRATCDQWP